MMKLSTLGKVGSMQREDHSSPIAETILSNWAYDPGSITWFRASANFIFQFYQGGEKRFLRFIEASEREREQIEGETQYLEWLDKKGIRVAKPIRSRWGNFVETVVTDVGTFHAVVFEGLTGQQFDIDDIDESRYQTWGAALGKLHAVTREYEPTGVRRKTWRDHLAFAREIISDEDRFIHDEWSQVESWANSLHMDDSRFGLIHYDFELDNLCWNGDSVEVLDFDDSSYYWYVADIAFALRDLFEPHIDLTHPSFQSFMTGYAGLSSLDYELLTQIPMFLRMHRLILNAKLMRSIMEVSRAEVPDWLKPLYDKFAHRIASYRLSLERDRA